MKFRFLTALLCFFILTPIQAAKQGSDIQTKIAIEKNLEERLHRILTEIIGTDKLIIVINAQLVSLDSGEGDEEVVLPGVPLQEKLGLGLAGLELGDTVKNIKKLSAQIIVDNGLPESMIKLIKEVSAGVLGLDDARGDILTVKKMNFRKNPFSWADIIYPPHLWGLLFTALFSFCAAAFFVFVMKAFPRGAEVISETLRGALQGKNAKEARGVSPIALVNPAADSLSSEGGSARKKNGGHFSFITPETVDKLIFLLKKEKPENIAVLLNYVPDISGRILSGLDKKLAREALSRLISARSLPGEEVIKWENELNQKLDFFIGGKDIVSDILENLSDAETDEYIAFIGEGDSVFAGELRESVFRTASLAEMSGENLLVLYQHFNPVAFANMLRLLPENMRKKTLDKLPQGISSRLIEEIELASAPGAEKLLVEKKMFSRLIAKLKKDGILKTDKTEA